jgi:uncharacterized membrane protein
MDSQNNNNQQGQPGSQQNPPSAAPVHTFDNKTLMGVLAYLSILVIIPFLAGRNDPFVKFHVKQGLLLAIVWIIIMVLAPMAYGLWQIVRILQLALVVFSIIGIINVVQNKEKELPLIGHLAGKFNI